MGDIWLNENPQQDWNTLDDFFFCSPRPTDLQYSQWMGIDSSQTLMDEPQHYPVHQSTEELEQPQPVEANIFTTLSPTENLLNVPRWLDGAYRPSTPCSHCRRHRLQCLILRTTSANPNPVTSCSSCVALFRECSLAKGEKRLPSQFETFSPVLGHLHGLPENADDDLANAQSALGDNPMTHQSYNIGFEKGDERKESKQFVRKGARVLREWFCQNQEYPYPSEAQKEQMSVETGFSAKRVSTWFANARRRQKQKLQSAKQAANSRSRAGSPLVTSTLNSMTPMERWQASPPDEEPVSESVIRASITSSSTDSESAFAPFNFDTSSIDFFNLDETSSHLASSASSFESKASETSDSLSSTWSHQSGDRNVPFPLIPKTTSNRQHRRQRQRQPKTECQYQCTFCISSFRKRHDWARHEKSVHVQLGSWICTLNINKLHQQYSTSGYECYFCDNHYPTAGHWEEHEFHICAGKPVTERSFSRKDYLWQHLRKFHSCTKIPALDLAEWRESDNTVRSRCGFCNQNLPTWDSRAEHLAAHFKHGARMDQWEGDWGLDALCMNSLRNAILPSQRSSIPEYLQ